MPVVKLTKDATVRALPTPDKGQVDYFDETKNPPGFAVRITPTGTRSFVFTYRHLGRFRRKTLGKFPGLPLAKARELAKAAYKDLQSGTDPGAEKIAARSAGDFASLADSFLESERKRLRPKTVAEWARIIERELKPRFGRESPVAISAADIESFLEKKAEIAPIMANRIHETIRRIFSWAASKNSIGIDSDDYYARFGKFGVRKPAEDRERDRVLSRVELRAVWEACGAERPMTSTLFHLWLLTATRRTELLDLRWTDIDWEKRTVTFPASNTKSKRALVLPLSHQALQALESLKPLSGHSPFVFVGPTGKAINNPQKAKQRIQQRSNVDFRIHDLRRTAATEMAALGVSDQVISRLLNHKPPGADATRIYQRHGFLNEMRVALQKWADHLERIVVETDAAQIMTFSRRGM